MTIEKRTDSESASRQSTTPDITGWGRYPRIAGRMINPETISALHSSVLLNPNDKVLGRGLGRSYGDAALSAESSLLLTQKLNRFLAFDAEKGVLKCEPGATYADIINTFLPAGWFPSVTPGTKYVTMGGALASDIHGKNHHNDGSFVDFVDSFKLLTASGQFINCSREENSDIFWATSGGMGLTGIISELDIRLRAVESAFMSVKKIRCTGLDETFHQIESNEKEYQYSVCWIDCLSRGKDLGRSILMLGRHALRTELENESQGLPDSSSNRSRGSSSAALTVPFDMPSSLLNRYSISAFNSVYFHLSEAQGKEKLAHFDPYFYPLDVLNDWNRMYGKAGFVQYQCVLPLRTSREGMEEILSLCGKRGRSSFFAVLKKFGAGHGLLSFPMEGYTLALDMPVKDGLFDFTKELDELVLKYGGRIYLAKDSCVSPAAFRQMYPELQKWQQIKKSIDPSNKFSSALSVRLKLHE